MGRSLRSSSFSVGLLLAACGGAPFETATALPESPRRPPGVALEPPPAYPRAVDRAEARGVVALRAPVGDEDVDELVRAYVDAFERGDERALARLVGDDGVVLGRPGTTRQHLLETWREKLRGRARSPGARPASLGPIERHTYETMDPSGAPRPAEMRPGDLYVRVPLASRVDGLGDVLVLLLRRQDGALRIVGQADE